MSDDPYDVALGVLRGFTMHEEVGSKALRVIEAENTKLREALEFYADPETYIAIGFFPDPPCGEFMEDFGETGTRHYGPRPGERARKALGYG